MHPDLNVTTMALGTLDFDISLKVKEFIKKNALLYACVDIPHCRMSRVL